MPTLLLRFDAPMQSWGTSSHFTVRETGREPSKSGVIGLLGAALGRPRDADFADLTALRMGVRVDREGEVRRDYHTAGQDGYVRIGGGVERGSVMPTTRYFLAGAVFLVGLEGPRPLLETLDAAVRAPMWALFFGRKAFPPAAPIGLPDGVSDLALRPALEAYPWLGAGGPETPPARVRLVLEDPDGAVVRHDSPLSFAARTFASRRMTVDFITPGWEVS